MTEEVDIPPRPRVTKAQRARVIGKSDCHCSYPGCAVTTGLEIDHVIPREIGGSDEDHNLVALCYDHHKKKTALDIKLIAKARRLRKMRLGLGPKKKPIASRGFQAGQSRPFEKGKRPWPKRPL